MRYSEKFREQMVRRLLGPSGVSAAALSREVGVPQPTLSRWLRGSLDDVSGNEQDSKTRPLKELSPEEKAGLVFEAKGLSGEELGAFLRRNGLHEADLEELRQWLADQLDPTASKREADAARKARKTDQKRIKRLERELQKKEKALAEAAALLVLQKKVQDLWGDGDDDTTGSKEN